MTAGHGGDAYIAGDRSEVTNPHRNAHSSLCRADQGRLLECVVRWGNLTEGKIRAYLGEVLEAVRYLHNCRIAHLDLKVSGAPGTGKLRDPSAAMRDAEPTLGLSSEARPGAHGDWGPTQGVGDGSSDF